MPLSLDDAALFPDLGEVIPVLMSADEVKSLAGRFAWAGPAFPAGDYSLRNMDKTRFKLIVKDDVEFVGGRRQAKGPGREVTEMDESQAYHELHPGAVYMHEGVLYEVLKLDLVSRTAEAVPFDVPFRPGRKRHASCRHFRKRTWEGQGSISAISM